MPQTAVIYARYSSDNQREASIEDQTRICREYCKQKGLTVIREYHDSALSGLTDNRPEFQLMIKDGERRVYDVLVLYSLDRFARNKYDSAVYKARLKKAGVTIAYVTTPIGDGPESVLMESLLEGMAQYYSENLARNVRRGLEGNALKGLWGSGSIPLGYRITPEKKLEIDPITASTVRIIFDMYCDGYKRSEIMDRLNREKRKTSTGNPFAGSSLRKILTNELYTGVYHYSTVTTEHFCEPIISREQFEMAQKMLKENAQSRARKTVESAEYILTGKLLCGCCGAWMIGMSGKNHAGTPYYYYACSKKSHGKGGCKKKNEPRDAVEQAVIAAAKCALTDERIGEVAEKAAAIFAAEADNTQAVKLATTRLNVVNKKIENIMAAIENGIYSVSLKDRLSALEEERLSAQAELARASAPRDVPSSAEIAYYVRSMRDGDLHDNNFRKSVVSNLINSVVIYDTPLQGKKIALAYNLTPDANEQLDCSSIDEKVGLVGLEPMTFTMST